MKKDFFKNYNVHPENQKILLQVLEHMRLDGKSETSIERYGEVGRLFLDNQKLIADITYDDVLNWLEEKCGNKSAAYYRNNQAILKSIFTRCYRLGHIKEVPVKPWWGPKVGYSLPKYLTDKEIAEVKMIAETLSERDRTLVEIYFGTGGRLSEICNLDIKDVDLNKGQIKIKGKGHKERLVDINSDSAFLLKRHYENHDGESEALFVSKYGKRLCTRRVQLIFKMIGTKLSIPRNLTPHMARHSYATQRVKRGDSVEEIKGPMGHSDISTTGIYAYIPNEDFKKKYHMIAG
ncbi:MAG: tyrosine-type recombinase/integrase [Bacillota bacterium]